MCATVAFGVGMDIPDINLVIHWDAADTMLDFVQQTGRAGRQGSASICITFYSQHTFHNNLRHAHRVADERNRNYTVACMRQVRCHPLVLSKNPAASALCDC